MRTDPKIIKKQFKKSIDVYEQHAVVQAIMADKLISALPLGDYTSILELGCGSGLLTKKLVQKIRYEKYYANDIVEKSKLYLDKILKDYVFLGGSALRLQVSGKFNLIISNALFQWFNDVEKSLDYFKTFLNKDGIIAFTTFSPDNYKEINVLTGLTLEYKSIDEIREILDKNFEIKYLENFEYTMHFQNPLEVLVHMKNTGVNALSSKPLGIKDVKIFCDNYKASFPDLTLTYSPIIAVARLKD